MLLWRSRPIEMVDAADIVLVLTSQPGGDALLLCTHPNLFVVLVSDLFFSPSAGILFYAGK